MHLLKVMLITLNKMHESIYYSEALLTPTYLPSWCTDGDWAVSNRLLLLNCK